MPKYRTNTTLEIDMNEEGKHYSKRARFQFYLCDDCIWDDMNDGVDY